MVTVSLKSSLALLLSVPVKVCVVETESVPCTVEAVDFAVVLMVMMCSSPFFMVPIVQVKGEEAPMVP